jgi:transcriptional regulator with XRE-family HTH domain
MEISGKKQIDLIGDLGFNRSTVSSWCTGNRVPSMDKIDILAKYFNIKFSDLIEDKKDEKEIELVAAHLEEVEDRAKELKSVDTQSTETDKKVNLKFDNLKRMHKFCRDCGNKLPINARFCDVCGSNTEYY